MGTEPDARFSLANERTFLAWIRTSLALLAGGVALEALNLPIEEHLRFSAALVLVVVGLIAPVTAWIGWAQAERAVRLGTPLALPVGVRSARHRRVRGGLARPDRSGDRMTGIDPSAPTTLAAERTHLAWRRTALGLTAGGVAAAHVLQEFAGAAAWSIAAAGAVVATALAVASRRRHAERVGGTAIDGRLVAVCACGVLLLGVVALAFTLLHAA